MYSVLLLLMLTTASGLFCDTSINDGMHLGTLNLWYKAASYKPKFIVPNDYPQDSLAFAAPSDG